MKNKRGFYFNKLKQGVIKMETEKIVVNQQYPEWINAILAKNMGQKETCSEIMNKGLGLGMSLNEIFQFIIAIYGISIAFSLFGNLGGLAGFGGGLFGNNAAATAAIAANDRNARIDSGLEDKICAIQAEMSANNARQQAYQKCDEEYRNLKNHEQLLAAIEGISKNNAIATERIVDQMRKDREVDVVTAMKGEIDSLKSQLDNQKFSCLQNEVQEIGDMLKGLYRKEDSCGCGCGCNGGVVYTTKNC
jgi:hypothetical protein